ncbi:MAG: tetratricopeptide repeat protein [Candidatus Hodarchaeota archaeon]
MDPKGKDVDWGTKGFELYKKDKFEESIEYLDKALEIDPEDNSSLYCKAQALGMMGKYEEALENVNKLLELDEEDNIAWFNKATYLVNMEKFKESLECYDRSLEIDPGYDIVHHDKAVALAQLGRHKEAIKHFNVFLENNPEDRDALYLKSVSLRSLGKYNESIESFQRAIALDKPESQVPESIIYFEIGEMYALMGSYEEAIENLDKCLKIDPGNIDALNGIGVCYTELGNNEKAIQYFDKIIEKYPEDYCWNNKGIALMRLEKYDDAAKAFEKAIEIDPEIGDAWYNKACLAALTGDTKNAIEFLKKAIDIDETNIEFARDDPELSNIKDLKEFKELVKNT